MMKKPAKTKEKKELSPNILSAPHPLNPHHPHPRSLSHRERVAEGRVRAGERVGERGKVSSHIRREKKKLSPKAQKTRKKSAARPKKKMAAEARSLPGAIVKKAASVIAPAAPPLSAEAPAPEKPLPKKPKQTQKAQAEIKPPASEIQSAPFVRQEPPKPKAESGRREEKKPKAVNSKPETLVLPSPPPTPKVQKAKAAPQTPGPIKVERPPEPKLKPASPVVKPPVIPLEPKEEKAEAAGGGVSPSIPAAKIPAPALRQKIKINEMITVSQLSQRLNVQASAIIKKLMAMGTLATLNQRLETDAAILACAEFGYDAEVTALYGEELFEEEEEKEEDLKPRPPIITIMGHVDHGKTSLLDAIRKSNITETEAGGITQHIGAYAVNFKTGALVFLDTPGHEAFSAMRARGAQATDIVILVVAADDGVMPQTVEAIDHARAANVPLVVAVNKVDLPAANVQRIKQELSQHNLAPEEWGGKTIFAEVSAKTGAGIENLLNMLLLQAEILELRANPKRAAQGIVVEARMDPKAGPRATVLVTRGTLRIGDVFVAGVTHGKAKALLDDRGRRLKEAGPSMPVEILGCEAVPHAGDRLGVLQDERTVREIAEGRKSRVRDEYLARHRHLRLDELYASVAKGIVKELKIILKADVRGSTQALGDSLAKLSTSEIKLSVIHAGVGGINESDVLLAAASDAIIIGFNVRPEGDAQALAEKEGVDIRTHRIIYEAVAEVGAAMEGLLEPESREVAMGRVEVRKVFQVPKAGSIAGCFVQEGKISRTARIRLLRDSVIIYEGKVSSLRRFKEDVREVEKGFECGVGLENFQDIKPGDLLEVSSRELVARKLAASEETKS